MPRRRHRRPHPTEIRVPKKKSDEADGKANDNDRPNDVAQIISILPEVSPLRHTPLIGVAVAPHRRAFTMFIPPSSRATRVKLFTRAPVPSHVLLDTKLDGLSLVRRGKVRDVYAAGDRPDPGRDRSHLGVRLRAGLGHSRQGPRAQPAVGVLVRPHRPHHPEPSDLDQRRRVSRPTRARLPPQLDGPIDADATHTPLPVECVARGYISGSGWKDYKATGEVCGIALPKGMRESDRLPEPIFTPATKAESGHDENISEAAAAKVVGAELLARLKKLTLELYAHGVAHAESKGIILADTKFEFGLTDAGELLLIDEMMTPDSSRYWPKDTYSPAARNQASTSSTCATISSRSSGTSSRRCRRCRPTWSRTRATSIRGLRRTDRES